jgi:hypothetical protein
MIEVNTVSYETDDVKQAAYLAASGHWPKVYRKGNDVKATFAFPNISAVHEAVEAYDRGAQVAAKLLLEVHAQLFHRASKAMRRPGI